MCDWRAQLANDVAEHWKRDEASAIATAKEWTRCVLALFPVGLACRLSLLPRR